jgi:hypothetical protein
VFCVGSMRVCSLITFLLLNKGIYAVAKPGVSKWGVKGEGTGGGAPPPAGGLGA